MSVPMVNSCCFCVSLHAGTLIIGYLYSIWALLDLTGYTLLVTLAPLGSQQPLSTHRLVLYVTAACVSGAHLLCSALLVLAAYKKLASLTLPWTIVTGVLTACCFLISLTGVSLILQDEGDVLALEIVFVVIQFARACISVYSIVVVHSRHKQIMLQKDDKRFLHSGRIYSPVNLDDQVQTSLTKIIVNTDPIPTSKKTFNID